PPEPPAPEPKGRTVVSQEAIEGRSSQIGGRRSVRPGEVGTGEIVHNARLRADFSHPGGDGAPPSKRGALAPASHKRRGRRYVQAAGEPPGVTASGATSSAPI